MNIRAYITHKQAENFSDCQDRFGVNPETRSIAVSDGMGSTWQQKIWAQLLVDTFTKSNDWMPTHNTIKPLCNTWQLMVESFIQHLRDSNAPDNIIYRNERGLALGYSAGATFVGIRFNGNNWQGSVLGDSCLIEWDGSNAKFHTSQDVEAFDSYPDYFDSDELKQGKGTPKAISGTLDKGGYLFLVSDPFSDFLFEHYKQGDVAEYMQQLLKLSSHEDFESLVDEWRKVGMHNDDTTLVIVDPDDSDVFSISALLDDIEKLIDEERKLIKDKKEEKAEQIPTSVFNESIEGENVDNVKEEDNQESTSIEQMELPSQHDSSNNEVNKNAIAIENQQEISIVDEEVFRNDFLKEYKRALKGRFPNVDRFKFTWTKRAVIDAVSEIFSKYSIFIK